ncbi:MULTISPECIES: hypothetical protein [Xanthomonas]|uniref:hypothetical protein n=1 Tax=Xanthomonas TaxID=338 RepID=UPI0030C85CD3
MHPFSELATRCAALTNGLLEENRAHVLAELQEHGTTVLVKALQAIELQGAIVAVGMVAMFDAALQDALNCGDGFKEALNIIEQAGEDELFVRFKDVQLAVNVLKHGAGRSHNELMARRDQLLFRVRGDDEFFNEGDVSELATLVEVDSAFLRYCSETIDLVAALIKRERPAAWV